MMSKLIQSHKEDSAQSRSNSLRVPVYDDMFKDLFWLTSGIKLTLSKISKISSQTNGTRFLQQDFIETTYHLSELDKLLLTSNFMGLGNNLYNY